MTEPETSVYVTDREELRKQIAEALEDANLVGSWSSWELLAESLMPIIDSLLEWGNGLDRQFSAMRATAGNLQKLLDASQDALKQQTEQAERIFALCGESPEECSASSLAAFVEEYIGRAQATIEARDRQLAELNGKLGERGGVIWDLTEKLTALNRLHASREAVEHVIDEHCCSADVTEAIVAKLFEFFHLYPREDGDSAADETALTADPQKVSPDFLEALSTVQSAEEIAVMACDGEEFAALPDCEACGGTGKDRSALQRWEASGVQSEVDTEAAAVDCGACFRCVSPKWSEFQSHPVVCATCGNKRCPHASDHIHACTGSNAYGQPGSDYAPLPCSSVRETGSSPLQDYVRVKKSFEQLARDVAEFAERASGVRDTEETVGCACCFAAHPETGFKRGQCISSESEPEGCGHSFKEHLINPARSSGDIEEKR